MPWIEFALLKSKAPPMFQLTSLLEDHYYFFFLLGYLFLSICLVAQLYLLKIRVPRPSQMRIEAGTKFPYFYWTFYGLSLLILILGTLKEKEFSLIIGLASLLYSTISLKVGLSLYAIGLALGIQSRDNQMVIPELPIQIFITVLIISVISLIVLVYITVRKSHFLRTERGAAFLRTVASTLALTAILLGASTR